MNTFREVAERYIALPSKRLGRPKSPAARKAIMEAVDRWGEREIDSFKIIDVTDYVEDLQVEGYKSATINSRLRYFIAALNYAKDKRGLIEAHHVPHFENLSTSDDAIEPRVLQEDEIHRLLFCLPLLYSSMARFALATGLRVSNIKLLTWSEVADGMLDIPAAKMKGGKRLFVPMCDEANVILAEQKALQTQRGQEPAYVFTKRNGLPMSEKSSVTSKAWVRACERAEVGRVRFHDFRHTWATRHVMSGTPLPMVQKLAGWSSMKMLERYTHLNAVDMRSYVNNGFSAPRNSDTQMGGSGSRIERKAIKKPKSVCETVKRPSKLVVELDGIEPSTSTLPVLVSKATATQLN